MTKIDNIKNSNNDNEKTLIEGLLYYLKIIYSHKSFIITLTSISAAIIFVFSVMTLMLPASINPMPNTYKANATLLLQEENSSNMTNLISTLGIMNPAENTPGRTAQILLQVFTSRSFIDQLLENKELFEKFGLYQSKKSEQRDFILGNSEFNINRNNGVVTISFEDTDPRLARNIVNKMVSSLEEWFLSQGGTSRQNQKILLEEKITEVSQKIDSLETELLEFQKENNAFNIDELVNYQSEILSDLRNQLVQTELAITNHLKFSKIEDSELIRLRTQRDNILRSIKETENGFSGNIKFMPAKTELPELSRKYTHLTVALEIQNRIYQELSERYEIIKLSTETDPVFQVLDWAETPDEKEGPQRGKICLIVVLLTFMLSSAIAILNEFIKKTYGKSLLKIFKR